MLRTRLWMGVLLIVLAGLVLVVDQNLAPYYPFLFCLVLLLAQLACFELLNLLPPLRRPPAWLCHSAIAVLLILNWIPHMESAGNRFLPDRWFGIGVGLAMVILVGFLEEMRSFRQQGESVTRMATAFWISGYLGLLPGFLVQLRWLERVGRGPGATGENSATIALALAIFVPKCCDIGAYFTGRFLGRHPMAPVLSPKKTWEGAAGGLTGAVLTAIGINRLGPVLSQGLWQEIGFGVTVGIAGMVGDLAESLIKRDCGTKDASKVVPGFGGVLDVVDSILFAAPIAYWWLR
jgi:phosphatidate cytidylyltransferase